MKISDLIHSHKWLSRLGTWLAFAGALIVYWLTADPSASWWDCPEYVLTAYRLEIGHSPGNPSWSLISNVIAAPVAAIFGVEKVAFALNLSSGLFTALAVALLFQICYIVVRLCFRRTPAASPLGASLISLSASLIFAWSDSPWFSAVETEVYALSLLFTALAVWLMLRWALLPSGPRADRLLILVAYITGFSIGVHELNLLVIPALALIFIFRRNPYRCTVLAWLALLASVGIIAIILLFWYPGTTVMAGEFELLAVNTFNLPFSSGVWIYIALLTLVGVAAPMAAFVRMRPSHDWIPTALRFAAVFTLLFLSGTFLAGRHFWASAAMSAASALVLALYGGRHPRRVGISLWMMTFCLIGFSSYLLIPIRSAANPPINENAPTDVFAFLGYLKRDQYGKRPLIYGTTPYAQPIYKEQVDSAGNATYAERVKIPSRPVYRRALPQGKLNYRSGLVDAASRSLNDSLIAKAADGDEKYILSDWQYDLVYTPELNMLFPRLTSHNDMDIRNYESWAFMKKENMDSVEVSIALDKDGNPVGRLLADGSREMKKSYRPTYLMNLQELFGYQIGYMYFRYLLWNYAGRQNDYPSAGEIEHGNFITGIAPLDNLMLGDQSALPPEIGSDNVGRNPYFLIPFALGIAGAVALCRRGRRGRRFDAMILTLFLMTGVAIVVYLNQDPGEPRERDYSFMGSFFAFAIWIAMGLAWLCNLIFKCSRKSNRMRRYFAPALCAAALAGVPVMMLATNYADHDRSRRSGPDDYASNLLNSLDPDAILFVTGDNYTFPVWYAQEVLGIRRDVTVVNLSYLLTSWYVEQLMIPGEESRPLEMTATPADIRYDAYSVVRVPTQKNRRISQDAVEALRNLYASKSGNPAFPIARLRIPTASGDSAVLDLTASSGGRNFFALRELAMIDILATNAASEKPRPVYWHGLLTQAQLSGFAPLTSNALYTKKFDPEAPGRYLLDESRKALPKLKWGGADKGIYADPYVGEQISKQRLALLRFAKALAEEGDWKGAMDVTRLIIGKLPQSVWPYQGVVPESGTVWQEGLEIASLLQECGEHLGDKAAVAEGEKLHREQMERLEKWEEWYNSLSPYLKTTVSSESLRLARFRTWN